MTFSALPGGQLVGAPDISFFLLWKEPLNERHSFSPFMWYFQLYKTMISFAGFINKRKCADFNHKRRALHSECRHFKTYLNATTELPNFFFMGELCAQWHELMSLQVNKISYLDGYLHDLPAIFFFSRVQKKYKKVDQY